MLAIRPTAPWARAAKLIRADGSTEPYRLGREFIGGETGWQTAAEAFAGLDALRHRPDICLIRGALAPSAPQPFARRYRGDERAILPCARRLLGLDFDAIGPAGSVREAGEIALSKLPIELRAGPVRVNLTASASRSNARVRVWLWLASPAGDRAARAALRGISDCALYNPVQPHYTADAIRETPDPWEERVWTSDLGGEATLGNVDDLAAQAGERLAIATRRIGRAKEGARHPMINAAAYELGRYVGAGMISRARVVEELSIASITCGLTAERVADEIGRALDDGERKPITEDAWRARLARTDEGKIKSSETNALAILTNDPAWADRIALDTAARSVIWIDPPPFATPGPIAAAEHLLIAQAIEADHRVTFSSAMLATAIDTAGHLAPIDPVREWLDDQPWDGVPRVDDALSDLLGAEPSDYVRGCSRAFFLSLADRVLHPGCQVDLALVLSGAQGCGKTSFLRDVGGPWYAELGDITGDEAVYTLARACLIELGELSAMNRSEVTRIKGFMSRTADTYRAKYARTAATVQRRCVFAGTTNEQGYLTDPTGNRRWLPVAVRKYDRERSREIMPFLLGEARERVRAGERYHDVPGAVDAQIDQLTPDPWIETVATIVAGRARVTMRDIALGLMLPTERTSPATSRRIASALRALGWTSHREGAGIVWTPPTGAP